MPRGGPIFRHAVVQSPKRDQNSVVASSRIYSSGPGAASLRKTGRRTRSTAWQGDLWDMYDAVPEFRFACSWVGNLLSKAVLEVHYKGEKTDNQHALDASTSLFGGPEGQEEMLRLLGMNFTVAGEAFVVGTPGPEEDDWQVIASVEVTGTDMGGSQNFKVEGEPLPEDALAIRLWKAHPRLSTESDCPSRALLPVLTQYVEISQVISAQASSRLTSAGILLVPSELELPAVPVTQQATGDDTEDSESLQMLEGISGLQQRLIQIASRAINDRSSAAAQVPVVIGAPGEFLEKFQHLEFWSGFDEHAKELREELVRRIAVGMDLPPEVVTGTGDVNHWGAWAIEEAAIKAHTEPLLSVIVSSLTTGYLQPYLEGMGVEDFGNYTFEANTSALRLRPNRSKEAIELYDRGELNGRTLLIENGFDPAHDAPTDDEKVLWFLAKVASGSTTPDQVAAALAALGVRGIPGTAEAEQPTTEAPAPRSLEEHPRRGTADEVRSEQRVEREIAASAGAPAVIDGLVLACEAHVHRALERVGNKLKNRVGGQASTEAADIYTVIPALEFGECTSLLEGEWDRLDRFSYPGVSTARLRDALNEYTLFLLSSQKQMTRASLARHLMMGLSEEAA